MVSESTTKNSTEKWSVAFICEETRLFQFVKCSSIFCRRVVYAWGSFCLFGFLHIVYYGFLDVLVLKFCSKCALCFLCFCAFMFICWFFLFWKRASKLSRHIPSLFLFVGSFRFEASYLIFLNLQGILEVGRKLQGLVCLCL